MKSKTYHIFFNNLANPLRVKIIVALKERDKCVKELAEEIKVEQSKLSHALMGLKSCKLVNVKQKGKNRIYSLNRRTLLPLLEIIDNHSKKHCGGRCHNCKFR